MQILGAASPSSNFNYCTINMAKHGLSEDEVADLKEAFSMFDIDGDGTFFYYSAAAIIAKIRYIKSPVQASACIMYNKSPSGLAWRWYLLIRGDI